MALSFVDRLKAISTTVDNILKFIWEAIDELVEVEK